MRRCSPYLPSSVHHKHEDHASDMESGVMLVSSLRKAEAFDSARIFLGARDVCCTRIALRP
ncbi:unnamed protein product [Ilex paraguariensis]|uniref:Uncharacterized protein n=1 Tax=Ilex paraguariensis TaxID=185542 RepID=A0ABC8QWH9_9AQUA